MKIYKGEQGTQEWLDWRKCGLGSTDISVLVGLNKYTTPFQVFEDKKGLSFPILENKYMTAGKEAEPLIRDSYNNYLGTSHEPICVESLDIPFLRGSLDGWDKETNSILEIKYSTFGRMSECIKKNDIEHFKNSYPQYNCQCQYFMYLMKTDKCDLATYAYNSDQLIYMNIPRDDELIDLIVKAATDFWNNNILSNTPPKKQKGDYIYVGDMSSIITAKELREVELRRKARAKEEKEDKEASDKLKSKLADSSDDLDFVVSDIITMTRVNQRRVDTKKLYLDYNINDEILDKYRVDGIGFWKVSLT